MNLKPEVDGKENGETTATLVTTTMSLKDAPPGTLPDDVNPVNAAVERRKAEVDQLQKAEQKVKAAQTEEEALKKALSSPPENKPEEKRYEQDGKEDAKKESARKDNEASMKAPGSTPGNDKEKAKADPIRIVLPKDPAQQQQYDILFYYIICASGYGVASENMIFEKYGVHVF